MESNIHLKVTAQSLTLLGYWPLDIKNKFLAFLYATYYKFTITVFVTFVLTQFIEIYMVIGKGLEEFSSLMAINFLYTLGLAQIWVIGGRTVKKLIKKIRTTERNILKNADRDEEVTEIFMKYVQKNSRLNKIILSLGVMCYFMFILTPPFTEMIEPPEFYYDTNDNQTKIYITERPLPLVSWFPYDSNRYYKISFTWHAIAGCINTAYIVTCKNVFFSLMIFIEGQIKILQHKIQNFATNRENEASSIENLYKTVEYHNAIIRYVQQLDDSMRYFLLMDCIACAMEIAMIGFEIAVADISLQLLKNIIYMGSMMTQLCLFYWRGNEIVLESTKVSDAIWESDWYKSSVKIRKILLQIMVKAQRPLKLSVGSFFYMSTQTMMIIIRSGYSYATVMRQFHTRKV